MSNIFNRFVLEHVIAHDIYTANEDHTIKPPRYGDTLLEASLSLDEKLDLETRIQKTLQRSACRLEADKIDSNSIMALSHSLILNGFYPQTDARCSDFKRVSKTCALRLAEAQRHNIGLPGGKIIIASCRVGQSMKPSALIIKAETDQGYQAKPSGLRCIKDLLFTGQHKLYKIALIVQHTGIEPIVNYDASNYYTYLYDHTLAPGDEKRMAFYFYDGYLGWKIPSDAVFNTARFYCEARKYILDSSATNDEKIRLETSLNAKLSDDNSSVVSFNDIACEFSDSNLKDGFINAMRTANIPNAFAKDTHLIDAKLKKRYIRFDTGVTITAPENQIDTAIEILPPDVNTTTDLVTTIKIHGKVEWK